MKIKQLRSVGAAMVALNWVALAQTEMGVAIPGGTTRWD
jgi:hypothetical protein